MLHPQQRNLEPELNWIPGTPRKTPFTVQELTLRTEAAIIQIGAIAQGIVEMGIPPALASGLRDLHDTYEAMRGIESTLIRATLADKGV